MSVFIKLIIVVSLMSLSIASCSSSPSSSSGPKKKQGNSVETQRSNAKQAQDELSSETSKR